MPIELKEIAVLTQKGIFTETEKEALTKLIYDLRLYWPGVKFKLFGSKINEVADEESDLDILVILPYDVTKEIRKQIIHKVFDINLIFETNISPLIISKQEWESDLFSLLPIHIFIEEEGVAL